MKASRIVSTLVAASLGLGSVGAAFAQDHDGRHDNGRHNGWQHRQQVQGNSGWQAPQRAPAQRSYQPHAQYRQPGYAPTQPAYAYRNHAPNVAYNGHVWHRGDRLPYGWRTQYAPVANWRAYNNLYAPPYGYQWVRSDAGDYMLVALATGLIANLLLNN